MTLKELRQKIDTVDAELTRLIEARLSIVAQIAVEKLKTGLPTYDPERERLLLDKIRGHVQDSSHEEAVIATFGDILKHSKDFQNKKRG